MTATLSERAREVLELVQADKSANEIAQQLGVTRNAVYQQIGKLRRDGYLPDRPSGPVPDEPVSVDATINGFKSSLEAQLRRIDAREQEIAQELERLRSERVKVDDLIARLD